MPPSWWGAECHPSARNTLLPIAQEGHLGFAVLRPGGPLRVATVRRSESPTGEGCLAAARAQRERRRTAVSPTHRPSKIAGSAFFHRHGTTAGHPARADHLRVGTDLRRLLS